MNVRCGVVSTLEGKEGYGIIFSSGVMDADGRGSEKGFLGKGRAGLKSYGSYVRCKVIWEMLVVCIAELHFPPMDRLTRMKHVDVVSTIWD